jgi:hypothetical protein
VSESLLLDKDLLISFTFLIKATSNSHSIISNPFLSTHKIFVLSHIYQVIALFYHSSIVQGPVFIFQDLFFLTRIVFALSTIIRVFSSSIQTISLILL